VSLGTVAQVQNTTVAALHSALTRGALEKKYRVLWAAVTSAVSSGVNSVSSAAPDAKLFRVVPFAP
jgi:hypothetical protein